MPQLGAPKEPARLTSGVLWVDIWRGRGGAEAVKLPPSVEFHVPSAQVIELVGARYKHVRIHEENGSTNIPLLGSNKRQVVIRLIQGLQGTRTETRL
jgi:hypothetical protein